MLEMRGLFSEGYNKHLERRDKIRALVLRVQEELKGTTLYDSVINISNPEELIATLYLLYKDKERYHEPLF